MTNLTPTTTPAESLAIAPECLEIANAYLENTLDLNKTCEALGLSREYISDTIAKKEVRAYINNVYFSIGFNNRGTLASAMDAVIRKKMQELDEADVGSSKDIAELLALKHKFRMEELAFELKLIQGADGPKIQNNVQINDHGGSNYSSLLQRLIEAGK